MSAKRFSPEIRAGALEAYQARGLAAAARETGIPKCTLHRWARAEGIDTAAIAGATAAQTSAATEAKKVYVAELREELRIMLLETACEMLERTGQPHIDYRGKDTKKVDFDVAPPSACREYVWAAGIAIDKFRLESGEATSHTLSEHGPLDQQKARVAKMRDELAERRAG